MAVTLDSTGTEQHKSGASISYTGLTIGSSLSNSAAVFVVCWGTSGATNITFSSPTWNGVSCPQIINRNGVNAGQAGVALFGIVNPTSGNQTFSVTPSVTTGNGFAVYGVSFSGVDQTGGATSFPHSAGAASGSTASLALTLTTANGNYTLVGATVGADNGSGTIQLGGVSTQDWLDTTDIATIAAYAAGKSASSGASAAWTAHNASADIATIAGTDVAASASGDVLTGSAKLFYM